MKLRHLAVLVAVLLLAAACTAGAGTGGQLEGSRWVLRSYDNAGTLTIVPDTVYADAQFSAQRVKGFSGCNDYDALYRAAGRTLLISSPAVTLKACSEVVSAFETTYLALLDQSRLYGTRRDTLTIYGPGGLVLLVFDAAPENPLLGRWNVDSYATTPGSQVATLAGTELTAVFGIVHVSGSAGCNTYDGTYGTNGTVVAIGRLATTQKACPDDVMQQEAAFLAALQGAAFVVSRGQTLELRDRADNIIVALSRPSTAAEASPSPTATPKPTATATPKPTAKPTATPTPTPKPTATAKPSVAPPSATGSPPAPTVAPPSPLPSTTSCAITGTAGSQVATIVYPADWFTVTEPASAACRNFSPTPITVPDPSVVGTAVSIVEQPLVPYANAVASATDPTVWTVTANVPVTISGLPATRVEATSTSTASGYPVGTTRYAYLIDLGTGGTAAIQTSGTAGDPAYAENVSVVDLMASSSTFTAP